MQKLEKLKITHGFIVYLNIYYGGERGIRTLGTFDSTHTFQAC